MTPCRDVPAGVPVERNPTRFLPGTMMPQQFKKPVPFTCIMDYSDLVRTYEKIEGTTKRLEIIDHLADFFRSTPSSIIGRIVLMLRGKVAPDYDGVEFGVAEKLALKAIAEATGIPLSHVSARFRETGDIGETAFLLMPHKKQTTLFSTGSLTVEEVFDRFLRIADARGQNSQEMKLKIIASLLHSAGPPEARYILRTLVGKLRLGVADMTIIEALAAAFATRQDRDVVEEAYNRCSNLSRVAETLTTEGLEGLRTIPVKVGVPLRSMLAERSGSIVEILERMGGRAAFEYKYDGLRVQAHITPDKVKLFSRNLEDITSQFPDLIDKLRRNCLVREAIVDGECLPVDPSTGKILPFQVVSQRRGRKYGLATERSGNSIDGEAPRTFEDSYPVVIVLFDLLFMDGESIMEQPYLDRRQRLENSFDFSSTGEVRLSNQVIASDPDEVEDFFNASLSEGCEGVMAKSISIDSVYRAGARGWQWIKYKADYRSDLIDTLDLVVVGAFAGKGRRTGAYGALLMAAWNPAGNRYETVCKLGTGFDDEMLAALPGLLEPYRCSSPHPAVHLRIRPDHHFSPGLVLEIFGAEFTLSPVHTCAENLLRKGSGIALRFPRFTGRIRDDKAPTDATTIDEIIALYDAQGRKRTADENSREGKGHEV